MRPEFCCAVTVPLTGTTTNLLWMGSMCLLSVSFMLMGVYKTRSHKMLPFLFNFCEIHRVGENDKNRGENNHENIIRCVKIRHSKN